MVSNLDQPRSEPGVVVVYMLSYYPLLGDYGNEISILSCCSYREAVLPFHFIVCVLDSWVMTRWKKICQIGVISRHHWIADDRIPETPLILVKSHLFVCKLKRKKSPFSRRSSTRKRPAAAVSRQGFSSPKIDWYDQSTCGQNRNFLATSGASFDPLAHFLSARLDTCDR
jgi:hypothetical protein